MTNKRLKPITLTVTFTVIEKDVKTAVNLLRSCITNGNDHTLTDFRIVKIETEKALDD